MTESQAAQLAREIMETTQYTFDADPAPLPYAGQFAVVVTEYGTANYWLVADRQQARSLLKMLGS